MTKLTITRTWIAGLIVLVAGLIVSGISLGLLVANGGTWVPAASPNNYNFVPTLDSYFWTTLGLTITGFTVAAAGGVVQLVAWIGALVNTYQIEDKTWFIVLLAGGIASLAFALIGFAAMVAYLIAGPEGTTMRQPRIPSPAAPPSTLVPAA